MLREVLYCYSWGNGAMVRTWRIPGLVAATLWCAGASAALPHDHDHAAPARRGHHAGAAHKHSHKAKPPAQRARRAPAHRHGHGPPRHRPHGRGPADAGHAHAHAGERPGAGHAHAGHAHGVDTEHIFGFVSGADIGERGHRELELDSVARIGKGGGRYFALDSTLEAKFTLTDQFRIAPGVAFAAHDIANVPGLADRRAGTFAGLSLQTKYALLARVSAPFGLTLGLEPHWRRVDETSGAPVDQFGLEVSLAADKELVPDRLYAAFNLLYEPEQQRSRVTGAVDRESLLGGGAAMAVQLRRGFFLGAEARYLRRYEGLVLDRFAGDAVYVGPNLFATLSERWWLAAAWTIQVAGQATDAPGALNLMHFERHQARLRLGYHF